MLRRLALLTCLAATAATAQGCDSGASSAPRVEPGAPAGDVLAVRGEVTARRGDEPARPLAVGDVVSGDDVVETGADGAVEIELHHNHARWALAGNQSKQVSESTAWRAAPRDPAADSEGGERTAAAGRHAEREAADTSASAPPKTASKAEEPKVESTRTMPIEPEAEVEVKDAEQRREEDKRAAKEKLASQKERQPDDQKRKKKTIRINQNCLTDPLAVDCDVASGPAVALASVRSTGGLDKAAARTALDFSTDQVEDCFADVELSKKTSVSVVLKVDADGAVASAKVTARGAAKAASACVKTAMRKVGFPAGARPSKITLKYEVTP